MKIIQRGFKMLLWLSIVLLLLMSAPRLLGFRSYAVTSGSMEPMLPVGTLLWIRASEEIQVDDVITFTLGKSVVTHRVERIELPGPRYVTKGDANDECDPHLVEKGQILGKVYMRIPYLGYLSMMLGNAWGKFTAASVLIGLALMIEIMQEKGGG